MFSRKPQTKNIKILLRTIWFSFFSVKPVKSGKILFFAICFSKAAVLWEYMKSHIISIYFHQERYCCESGQPTTGLQRKMEKTHWVLTMSSFGLEPRHVRYFFEYCWFSHDVTKIQTKKTMDPTEILLSRCKANFHINFRFERVLGFVVEYAWISKLLPDASFTCRPRELSCRFKKMIYFRKFCCLNGSCIRKSMTLMFMSFSKNKFTLL